MRRVWHGALDKSPEQPLFERADWMPMGVLLALALAVEAGTALLSLRGSLTSLSQLGVYFDGHLYLEIAKSFPLPYAAEGSEYLGQAPGFAACIYLTRLLSFGSINWGLLAILCAWIPGALAALVFYLLCKQTGTRPFWGGVLFVCGNPVWMTRVATAHPEPLAAVFAMLCFLAYLRGRMGWSVAWLSLAALSRFPAILLGLPLAFGVLVLRRALSLRNLVLLSVPLAAFGVFNLYLYLRIPGFLGVMEAHSFWWDPSWTWPFAALLDAIEKWPRTGSLSFAATYASALFYVAAFFVGLRPSERELWFLPLWVAVIVLLPASLSGIIGVQDFARLVLLAWPAALLIVWRALGPVLPRLAVVALCTGMGALGLWFASHKIGAALWLQGHGQPFLKETLRRLDTDEPYWVDFRAIHRERQRRGAR
jgi:hypothetical protein